MRRTRHSSSSSTQTAAFKSRRQTARRELRNIFGISRLTPTRISRPMERSSGSTTGPPRGKPEPYETDQVVVDSNGNVQVVQLAAGMSGAAPPIWSTDIDEGTSDNDGAVMWINEGPPTSWLPNTPYAAKAHRRYKQQHTRGSKGRHVGIFTVHLESQLGR